MTDLDAVRTERVAAAVKTHDGLSNRIKGARLDWLKYAVTMGRKDPSSVASAPLLACAAADRIPALLGDLDHAFAEAAAAHTHHAAAVHGAQREQARADRLEDEIVALTAKLDQAEAALRDREVTS